MKSKNSLFLILCIFTSISVHSQSIKLKFVNDSTAIPYVNISDSLKNVSVVSDKNGVIILQDENYHLSIHHVSYEDTLINLSINGNDTTIIIDLTKRIESLNELLIRSNKKKFSKQKYQFGYFKQRSNGTQVLYTKLKLGYYIKNPDSTQIHLLKSIKFKLLNSDGLNSLKAPLEIKILPVKNGLVGKKTLNFNPLLIALSELKRNNNIGINEYLTIPKEGVFISFELPQIFDDNKKYSIEFMGNWNAESCKLYILKNNGIAWDEHILTYRCHVDDIAFNGSFNLNLSITYVNEILQ